MTTFNELARAAEKTDSLTRAINRLKVKEVAPGKFVYGPVGIDGRYWLVRADVLAEWYQRYFDETLDYAREGFILDNRSKLLPSWWTPTRQFAYRFASSVYSRRDDAEADAQACAQSYAFKGEFAPSIQRVTVNLETGEEVPV